MEFLIGGAAAVGAGFFTNPLEVLKTRMQLQGELRAKGQHAVYYKNVLHAGYVVAKNDGVLALQKGLVPALWVQLVLNGMRLGEYTNVKVKILTANKNLINLYTATSIQMCMYGCLYISLLNKLVQGRLKEILL